MKSFLEWIAGQERGEEWLAAERRRLMGWDREDLIDWLKWNDHNGSFTDEEAEAEDMEPLDVKGAVDIIMRHVEENLETPEEMMHRSKSAAWDRERKSFAPHSPDGAMPAAWDASRWMRKGR